MESPGALLSGAWFSSWYVISIDTGRIAQSPQSGQRWSPAFKIEPILFPPSEETPRIMFTSKGKHNSVTLKCIVVS